MMDPEVIRSAEALAKTGLAAWASKELISKLLGPTADYLGQEVATFADKCNLNLSDIFKRAARKLGERVEEPGQVPPRVLRALLEDGAYAEDPLVAEYFGGVLASSRSPTGRDDRGNSILATLRQLSVYDIRLHYLLYTSVKMLYDGDSRLLSNSTDSQSMLVFIPYPVYVEAMEFLAGETPGVIRGHSVRALLRCGLALQGAAGDARFLQQWSKNVEGEGLLVQPSGYGSEVYLWAHGYRDTYSAALLDRNIQFDPLPDVPRLVGAKAASNDGDLPFGRQ